VTARYFKIHFLFILAFVCSAYAKAQSPVKLKELAKQEIDNRNWPAAYDWAKQAYMLDSANFEAQVLLALCANEIKEYEESKRIFESISEKDVGKLQPDANYYLARALKELGFYEDAEIFFRKYVKKSRTKNILLKKKAEQEIKNCAWALKNIQTDDSLHVYRLPNTLQHESADVFPRLNDSLLNYYFYDEEKKMWNQVTRPLGDGKVSVRTPMSFGYMTFLGDTAVGVETKEGISSVLLLVRQDTSWVVANKLEKLNEGNSTMPHLVRISGVLHLFFVSDREGGEGGKDIWIARETKGVWGKPFNAGSRVNTIDDEISPFYFNYKLYFTSTWYEGFGGWEIYYSNGKPGSFQRPENAGRGLNSNYNDWGLSFNQEKGIAFFSSDRPLDDGSKFPPCCTDLYAATWQLKEEEITKTKTDSLYTSLYELNKVLPVKLYFHNDEPNPDSNDTTTAFTYSETFDEYLKLKETYIRKLGKEQGATETTDEEVDAFFENQVQQGMSDLILFEDLLKKELLAGNNVKVTVRGFASPRAASDYNRRLSLRRIASLKNKWMKDEVFQKAFETNTLEIIPLPFGENQSKAGVSDDIKNEMKSIYSKGARLERRIEIESVSINKKEEDTAKLEVGSGIVYLGRVAKGSFTTKEITISNSGSAELKIDSVEASCGCTVPVLMKEVLAPGEKTTLKITFSAPNKTGKEVKFVTLFSNGNAIKVITVEAIVE
jgi:tetratricopeptide (TPR) repeat protein